MLKVNPVSFRRWGSRETAQSAEVRVFKDRNILPEPIGGTPHKALRQSIPRRPSLLSLVAVGSTRRPDFLARIFSFTPAEARLAAGQSLMKPRKKLARPARPLGIG
jgi:hypothetical protein